MSGPNRVATRCGCAANSCTGCVPAAASASGLAETTIVTGSSQLVASNTTVGREPPVPAVKRPSAESTRVLPSPRRRTVTSAVGARVRRSSYVSGLPADTSVEPPLSVTSSPPVSSSRTSASTSDVSAMSLKMPPASELVTECAIAVLNGCSATASSTAATLTTNGTLQFEASKVIVAGTVICAASAASVTVTTSSGAGARVSATV
jgi:hypothetical protein